MGGLPSYIIKQCIELFTQCNEFNSNERLLSFFQNHIDLYPYYSDLPAQNSIKGRVEQTIAYLTSKSPELNKNELLIIFIENLKEGYSNNDNLNRSLEKLSKEILSYFTNYQNNTERSIYEYIDSSIPEQTSNPQKIVYSHIENTKIIQIRVSQMFQIFDLFLYPKSKQGHELFLSITDFDKFRRMLNSKKKISVSSYGSFQPIMNFAEKYKSFWKPAAVTFSQKNPLLFIPLTLDLTEYLIEIQPESGTFLEKVCHQDIYDIENIQINGHLRVYPPGSGIITLNVTLTFRESVYVELVAEIAHNIQDLLFVDSDGKKSPCSDFFVKVIDDLSKRVFSTEDQINKDRRWLPPETTFIFRDYSGISLDKQISNLTLLMALSKGNKENWHELKSRVIKAISSPHWQRDRMIGITGQNTSIIIINKNINKFSTKLEWFIQTREIITAAVYAQKACYEKLDEISGPRTLRADWFSNNKRDIDYISKIIKITHEIMQAIYSLKFHIQKLGVGTLFCFAKDLWKYNNPINIDNFITNLNYIDGWLKSLRIRTYNIRKTIYLINEIKEIKIPFNQQKINLSQESNIQSILETSLLNDLQLLRNLLKSNNTDSEIINNLIIEIQNIHKFMS